MVQEKKEEGRRIRKGEIMRGGDGGKDNLGRDATFPWSRVLTHPPRCNRTRHRIIQGHRGHMVAILDSMPLFRLHDVNDTKVAHILLPLVRKYQSLEVSDQIPGEDQNMVLLSHNLR